MGWAELLNVAVRGPVGGQAMVFVHGFGCGQEMWRHVAPAFENEYRVVLLDLPGSGGSALTSYDSGRHGTLQGYADDLAALLRELDLRSVVLVGHSVSAMIGVLLRNSHPDLVAKLVLISPSARYLDDVDYVGGFTASDIDDLLDLMSRNHLGWQNPLAGMVAGGPEGETQAELEQAFCRTDPEIAAEFASVTFRGDNRSDLVDVAAPTLVVQARDDAIAPVSAGAYVHSAVANSEIEIIETRGHCPHLTAPDETVLAIRRFLGTAPE